MAGRSTKSEPFSLRVPVDQMTRAKRLAEINGLSLAGYVLHALDNQMDRDSGIGGGMAPVEPPRPPKPRTSGAAAEREVRSRLKEAPAKGMASKPIPGRAVPGDRIATQKVEAPEPKEGTVASRLKGLPVFTG